MTNIETLLSEKIMQHTSESFIAISIFVLIMSFIVRLIFRETGFEFIKYSIIIPFTVITIVYTIMIFQVEQALKQEDIIFNIQKSNLSMEKKDLMIKNANNNIESLKKIKVDTLLYSLGYYTLCGLFLILIRDTFSIIKKKYRKPLE